MSKKTVYFYALFLKQNVKAYSHGTKTGVKMGSHKVCQIEFALRGTYEQRSSFRKSGHMLTGEIAVGQKSAAVYIAFQSLIV